MRSNNAFTLLPYNVFEFTLLAELIAAELGVEPGPYFHFASSMHVYCDEKEGALAAARAKSQSGEAMDALPVNQPLAAVQRLVNYERDVREAFQAQGHSADISALLDRAEKMPPYWRRMALILLDHWVRGKSRGQQSAVGQ